jgi:hypothetical protein
MAKGREPSQGNLPKVITVTTRQQHGLCFNDPVPQGWLTSAVYYSAAPQCPQSVGTSCNYKNIVEFSGLPPGTVLDLSLHDFNLPNGWTASGTTAAGFTLGQYWIDNGCDNTTSSMKNMVRIMKL